MLYVRNVSKVVQWIEDRQTGLKRRVEPNALAQVSQPEAIHLVDSAPGVWDVSAPIALPPPDAPGGS
jgi:hypothetical protein